MNRLLIRTNANNKIGFGHLIRCLALADNLKSDFEILFVLNKTDPFFYDLINKQGFKYIEIPEVPQFLPDDSSSVEEISFDLLEIVKTNDYVILDGYRFGTNYRKICKMHCCKLICIEDYPNGYYLCDIIICPSPIQYQFDSKDSRVFNGLKYFIIRQEFFDKSVQYKRDGIVISLGGNDTYQLSNKLLQHLLEFTNYNIKLIYTDLFDKELQSVLISTYDNNKNRVKLIKNCTAKELNIIFRSSEHGFFTASTTLIEAIYCKVNVNFGYIAKNQIDYFNFFAQIFPKKAIGNLIELDTEKTNFNYEPIEYNFELNNAHDWVNVINNV